LIARWDHSVGFTEMILNTAARVEDLGISTAAIVARIDAGENPADLAADYKVSEAAITDAIVYERAA